MPVIVSRLCALPSEVFLCTAILVVSRVTESREIWVQFQQGTERLCSLFAWHWAVSPSVHWHVLFYIAVLSVVFFLKFCQWQCCIKIYATRPWGPGFDPHKCHQPLQVCVAHGVIAWELDRAKSSDLGTENSRQGEIGLKGAARTRRLQFCSINLYAHTTQLSAQIVPEWYVHKDLCNKTVRSRLRSPQMPPAVTSLCMRNCSPWSDSLGTWQSQEQWPGDWEFSTRGDWA